MEKQFLKTIEKQRLIFSGKEITDNDNKKISDLGIKKETTLQLLYKRPMMPKPPKDFFGDSVNDFIMLSYANSIENIEKAIYRLSKI